MTSQLSKLRVPPARAKAGKKIDTWRMNVFGQSCEVPIYMLVNDGKVSFSAEAKHDALKGMSWTGTDLEDMRRQIERDIAAEAEKISSTTWEPSLCIEVKNRKPIGREVEGISIEFGYTRLLKSTEAPIGNQGQTQVFQNGQRSMVFQRATDQAFESSKSDLSSANLAQLQEKTDPKTRVLVPATQEEAIKAITSSLKLFSKGLERRMSPDQVRFTGLPDPQELVEILQEAVNTEEPEVEQDLSP